jgi:hypothetical protein
MSWFYLSYATPKEFLGGVIVEASDVEMAVGTAAHLGIAPQVPDEDFGGNYFPVQGVPADPAPPEEFRNRLLTLEDLIRLDEAHERGSTN